MKDCVEDKRLREQRVLEEMIRLYCRKQHPGQTMPGRACCPDCQDLLVSSRDGYLASGVQTSE